MNTGQAARFTIELTGNCADNRYSIIRYFAKMNLHTGLLMTDGRPDRVSSRYRIHHHYRKHMRKFHNFCLSCNAQYTGYLMPGISCKNHSPS